MIDLTLPMAEDMGGFPGYPPVKFERLQDYAGDDKRSHHVCFPTHQGTHIDAPAHFIPDGETIDEVDPSLFRGSARVLDLRAHAGERLTAEDLAAVAPDLEGERVILLTGDVDARFGEEPFFEEAAVLTADAAGWLLEREVPLLANDFLTESIEDPERPVHHLLLGAGVPIVEYLCNADAVADAHTVELCCPPIPLAGLEAAPARVLVSE